jgi:hypothetical protein
MKSIKLHGDPRSRAPTGDFKVAIGHGHPLVTNNNLEIYFNKSLLTCIISEAMRGGPTNIVFELFG